MALTQPFIHQTPDVFPEQAVEGVNIIFPQIERDKGYVTS